MRGVTKLLLAAALALLLAIGFAACGGDSDDPTTGSAATTTETAPSSTPDASTAPPDKEPAGGQQDSGSSPQEGSASFRRPGGDNSIQNYGEEADEGERDAASAAALSFMGARAVGDWEGTCAQLSSTALKPIEQLADRSPGLQDKDCAELLEALVGKAPASARASTLGGEGIDSLRFEGERGFALYHGTDGQDYYLPLVKEDGEWKVGALGPSEFPG